MKDLTDGTIAANTACPYKTICTDFKKGFCIHRGVGHPVPYTCAKARSIGANENPKK